jgi:NADPH2:quinone reductase
MKAVRFHRYGGVEVLQVEDVEPRPLGSRDVLVRVRAAGINPGEAKIRTGALRHTYPATFPSGQGSDLAGTVVATGNAVSQWAPDDPVLGWSWERSSHAEYVVVPENQLIRKPDALPWTAAGALYVAGCTAWAAITAVDPQAGETVVVIGATGGVGSLAIQVLRLRRANVLAVASARHRNWVEAQGATLVEYGSEVAERLRLAIEAEGGTADAFLDFRGGDHPRIALALGVPPRRINTLDYEAAARLGTSSHGSIEGTSREVLAELAELAAAGRIEVPISRSHPLAEVSEAFRYLEDEHPLGKVVLLPF